MFIIVRCTQKQIQCHSQCSVCNYASSKCEKAFLQSVKVNVQNTKQFPSPPLVPYRELPTRNFCEGWRYCKTNCDQGRSLAIIGDQGRITEPRGIKVAELGCPTRLPLKADSKTNFWSVLQTASEGGGGTGTRYRSGIGTPISDSERSPPRTSTILTVNRTCLFYEIKCSL